MIRTYLDWNVIQQMKNGTQEEIKNILYKDEILLLFYSTAHIGDIYSSYSEDKNQLELIKRDLEYLSDITKDNCLSIEPNNSTISVDRTNPEDLFEQKIESELIYKDFSLDRVLKGFIDMGMSKEASDYVNLLEKVIFTESFIQALSNPESSKTLDLLFPGLKDNPTLDGVFSSFKKRMDSMNNDIGYGDSRTMYQTVLQSNPAVSSNWKDPFKEYDVLLKTHFGISLEDIHNLSNSEHNKQTPSWFTHIVNYYISLDMSGFKQDKITVKSGKKKTFKNTMEDSFHATYASVCDIYVINDTKSRMKTKAVFEHFNVNTKVFDPQEFINYYKTFLDVEQGYSTVSLIADHIKSDNYYSSKNKESITQMYCTDYFFFNFFNRIYLIYTFKDNKTTILLSREKPTNGRFTLLEEVETLIKNLIMYFGNDDKNIGNILIEEFQNLDSWIDRTWKLQGYNIELKQINGFFQMYIVIDESTTNL